MKIYPAIDIKNGKCVRLFQGQADQVTEYGDDPVTMALNWINQKAKRLHLVDLDGAFSGSQAAKEAILRIRKATDLPLQVGGGIRTEADVKSYLDAGIDRVILGTVAISDPELTQRLVQTYGDRIVVSVDARDGYVTTDGWVNASEVTALSLFEKLDDIGVKTVVYTDISRDGAMTGPNLDALAAASKAFSGTIIASGGVSSMDDLKALESIGIQDAIIGKAIYEGSIDLTEAVAVFEEKGR